MIFQCIYLIIYEQRLKTLALNCRSFVDYHFYPHKSKTKKKTREFRIALNYSRRDTRSTEKPNKINRRKCKMSTTIWPGFSIGVDTGREWMCFLKYWSKTRAS